MEFASVFDVGLTLDAFLVFPAARLTDETRTSTFLSADGELITKDALEGFLRT
jgi:hypothetical protein